MTISQIRAAAAGSLSRADIENYDFEAMQIVSEYTSKSRAQIALYPDVEIDEACKQKIDEAIARRACGEPLQYILGYWEFYSLKFMVEEGVLIPRPETELLVDLAIERAAGIQHAKILDLCCGSGCIAVSAFKNIAGAKVYAADFYDTPLKVTAQNAELHGADINIVRADALDTPPAALGTDFDMILSNPPYIPSGELAHLQKEVQREPQTALDGGDDGLDFYRRICRNYSGLIKKGGLLAFEIGIGQHDDVKRIMTQNGLTGVTSMHDLAGIQRVIYGTLQAAKA